MPHVLIEMDRGDGRGFRPRVDCQHPITAEDLARQLAAYALQHPHRAWLDGVLIATAEPVPGQCEGKVTRC